MFRVFYRTPDEALRNIPERWFDTADAEEAYTYQRRYQGNHEQIVRVVYKSAVVEQ